MSNGARLRSVATAQRDPFKVEPVRMETIGSEVSNGARLRSVATAQRDPFKLKTL